MGKCRIRQQSDIKSHRQRERREERLLSKRSRGDETRQQPSCIVLARVVRIDRSMHSALLMMMTMSHRPPSLSFIVIQHITTWLLPINLGDTCCGERYTYRWQDSRKRGFPRTEKYMDLIAVKFLTRFKCEI